MTIEYTKEQPTESGIYWARLPKCADVAPEDVCHKDPEPVMAAFSTQENRLIGVRTFWHHKWLNPRTLIVKAMLWSRVRIEPHTADEIRLGQAVTKAAKDLLFISANHGDKIDDIALATRKLEAAITALDNGANSDL